MLAGHRNGQQFPRIPGAEFAPARRAGGRNRPTVSLRHSGLDELVDTPPTDLTGGESFARLIGSGFGGSGGDTGVADFFRGASPRRGGHQAPAASWALSHASTIDRKSTRL